MPSESPPSSPDQHDGPKHDTQQFSVEEGGSNMTQNAATSPPVSKRDKEIKEDDSEDEEEEKDFRKMDVTNPKQLLKYINAFYADAGDKITTGAYISVKNLNFSVATKKHNEMKPILKDLSFYIKPGMMVLVLGNPGGGRSSLLKILADVVPKDDDSKIEGQILYNDRPIDPSTHHRDVGYITQGDYHIPTLTVKETLEFSSACIVPPEFSNKQHDAKRLQILMSILGLERVQDTLIGNEFIRGISGGQKKRVTIGVDMCKGAQLLLMDEPTTGLDSVTTLKIMGSMKSFTQSGRVAVVCALLQPPREVFELFDHVLILDDGEIPYFGKTSEAAPYFNRLGFAPQDPDLNPAEFLQEVVVHPEKFVAPGVEPPLKTVEEFTETFKESPEYAEIMKIVSDRNELIPSDLEPTSSLGKSTYINGPMRQFQLNLSRSIKITVRNKVALGARALKIIFLAIIIGTVYLNIGNTQQSANARRSVIFFSIFQIMFSSLITIRDLYDQRPIFYEQRDLRKWYTTLPYFAAYVIPQWIIGIIEVMVFACIMYYLVDLHHGAQHFIFFVLILFAADIVAWSILLLISALTPSSVFCGTILPSSLLLLALASGFLIPRPMIPGWWIWLYWASPLKWVYEGLMINEYVGLKFYCTASELVPKKAVADALFEGNQVCQILTGEQVLRQNGLETAFWFRWIDLAVTLGFAVLLTFIAYLSIRFYDQSPRAGTWLHSSKKQQKRDRELNESREEEMQNATSVTVPRAQQHEALKIYGSYLAFNDVNYFVDTKKGELQLLHNVSGYVKPGNLLALMGASGAGKSTLLDVLANRKSSGRITGDILINGKERQINYTRYAAYVTQNDILFVTHTVKEAITFSAMNRLPQEVPVEEKMEFVEQILDDLELRPLSSRIIGSGLSVEQRKRLNLAVELAANPQLIFLDEPTSGLDSVGARIVMNVVKKLSMQGRSIICTIHQPSAEIFQLFDSLLLLAAGGDVVYFGELGEKGSKVMAHANELGYYMQEKRNIADFVLEFSEAYARTEDESQSELTEAITGRDPNAGLPPPEERNPRVQTKQELTALYKKSKIRQDTVDELTEGEFVPSDFNPPVLPEKYATGFVYQLKLNMGRSMLSLYSRRRNDVIFQWARMLVFGIFMGTIFIRFELTQAYITERVAWIFFSSLFGGFIGFSFIPMMFAERSVFYHEQASGTYRPSVYGLTLVVSFIPLIVGASILYMFPAYWIPTFDPHHSFSRFLFFLLCQFLASLVLIGVAMLLAVGLPIEGIAVMLAGVIYPLLLLFAGFFIPRIHIPGWWIWMYWISWLHYAVEPQALEIFKALTFTCKPSELVNIPTSSGIMQYCPLTTYDQIVEQFGLLPEWKWIDVGINAASFFAFAGVACILLTKVRWEKT